MNDMTREGEVQHAPKPGTAIAEFSVADQAIAMLGERLQGITYDFTKAGEMARAIRDRAEVRGYRTDLERKRVEVKEEIVKRGRLIDGEAKRIREALESLENPIDEQIKAEEGRKQREKEEREQKERDRIASIQSRIAWFGETASSSAGMSSADTLAVIGSVDAMEIDETFAEFRDQARGAKEKSLSILRQMHAGALAQEQQKMAEERRRAEEAEKLAREREELAKARAAQEAREREEAERRARQDAEDRERRAKIEEEERAARERREAEEREHKARLAEEERKAREAREAAEKLERESLQKARMEVEAREAAAREERERLDEERRAVERERAAIEDFHDTLARVQAACKDRPERAGILKAINDYFAEMQG